MDEHDLAHDEHAQWQRLGQIVEARLRQLRLTQGEAAERAGMSEDTVNKIVNARQHGYRTKTLGHLSKALGWPEHALDDILAGADPGQFEAQEAITGTFTTLEQYLRQQAIEGRPIDYFEVTDSGLDHQRDVDLRAALSAILEEASAAAGTVGKSIGRLDLPDYDPRQIDPPPDFLVKDRSGKRAAIEVKTTKAPTTNSDDFRQLVGLATIWQRQGAERIIVFSTTSWSMPIVEALATFGIEHADSQEQLELLLTEGGVSYLL